MGGYLKLRYKNKATLIRRILKLLKIPANIFNEIERNAVSALIQGYDFNEVLQEVKNGGINLPNYNEHHIQADSFDFSKIWSGHVNTLKDNKKIHIGQQFNIKISVTNQTDWLFATTNKSPIFASYHWYDMNGEVVLFDGIRSEIPFNIWPGETSEFDITVIAPDNPGDYLFAPALLIEGLTWLDELGMSITKSCIHVNEKGFEMSNNRTLLISDYLKKLNFARGLNANIN